MGGSTSENPVALTLDELRSRRVAVLSDSGSAEREVEGEGDIMPKPLETKLLLLPKTLGTRLVLLTQALETSLLILIQIFLGGFSLFTGHA